MAGRQPHTTTIPAAASLDQFINQAVEAELEDEEVDTPAAAGIKTRSARISKTGYLVAQLRISAGRAMRTSSAIGSLAWSIGRLRVLELEAWLASDGHDAGGVVGGLLTDPDGNGSATRCVDCGSVASRSCSKCSKSPMSRRCVCDVLAELGTADLRQLRVEAQGAR